MDSPPVPVPWVKSPPCSMNCSTNAHTGQTKTRGFQLKKSQGLGKHERIRHEHFHLIGLQYRDRCTWQHHPEKKNVSHVYIQIPVAIQHFPCCTDHLTLVALEFISSYYMARTNHTAVNHRRTLTERERERENYRIYCSQLLVTPNIQICIPYHTISYHAGYWFTRTENMPQCIVPAG